jgi:hypothetical protein
MSKQDTGNSAISFQISRPSPLIIVKGTVNNTVPANFIVDTGASLTMLSREVAKQAGVRLDGKSAKAAGPDGSQMVTLATVRLLTLGAMQLKNVRVALMDFAGLNEAAKIKAGGILGYNLLRRYCVTIDYSTRTIHFTPVPPQKRAGSRKLPIAAGKMPQP